MGLFGLREEKTDKDVQQERLYAARNAYDDRRTAFRDVGDTIELDCLEGQSWLPYAGVQLPVDTNTYVQFPEVNSNYRCVRLRIDRMLSRCFRRSTLMIFLNLRPLTD